MTSNNPIARSNESQEKCRMPHIRHPVFRIVTYDQLLTKVPKIHAKSTNPQNDAYTSLGLPHNDVYSSTLNSRVIDNVFAILVQK